MTTPSKTAEAVERLKPCPLCGNADIYVAPDEVGSGGQWVPPVHVGCRECCLDLVDLKTDTREGAIAAWNQRTAQQSDARVREALETAWTGRTHDLKTWPEPYDAVAAGLKPWELRFNDCDYQVGDRLRLRRWVPLAESYSGEETTQQVVWLLEGPAFGLPKGFVIMSLASLTAPKPEEGEPIPMVLHCPACGVQHIDKADEAKGWTNPPHRSHLCQACGHVWRPADVPTTGVAAIQTRGKADSPASPAPSRVEPVAFLIIDPDGDHDRVDWPDLEDQPPLSESDYAEGWTAVPLGPLTTPPDAQPRMAALDAWEWLASQTNLSLDRDDPPDAEEGDPMEWLVWRVTGNRSDREWDLVGRSSASPLAAVLEARAALKAEEKG